MCPGWLATPLCAVGRVLLGRENLCRVVKHKNPDGSPLAHLSLGTVGSPQESSRASPAESEHSFPGTRVPGEAPQRGLSAGVTLQKCHLHASCWHEGVLKPLQSLPWLAAVSGVRLNHCCPGTALGRGPGLPFIAQPAQERLRAAGLEGSARRQPSPSSCSAVGWTARSAPRRPLGQTMCREPLSVCRSPGCKADSVPGTLIKIHR